MDWAFLPPEINSARMYTGPGMGSLLAAAGSWDALSAELSSTAEGYESALSGLDLQWRGPAAQAMALSAARYVAWLQATAEQTAQTAMQTRTAAAAYEQAYAMTVPPPVITANRALLASLVATNIVGQNTAAIADTEAQYANYWAQDAAAMSGYSVSSAAATQLPQFAPANNSTNESGVTAQKAAVTAANTNAATNKAVTQTFSALDETPGTTVNNFYYLDASTTSAANANANAFRVLDAIQGTGLGFSAPYNMEQFVSGIIGAENNLGVLAKPLAAAPALAAPALSGATTGVGGGLGNVTATLSRAGSIGPMSVPASWAAPTSTHISPLEPAGFTTLPGTEEPVASGYPGYPGMPGGGASRSVGAGVPPRYGVRLTVMPRPPAAG
ncbi:PPE family protein [Mycobacterium marseillense]|uniref:PPE family protein n=1 Tax=Mycobacterium marseillense TaxID=701042 RepID=UPI002591C1D2|nr:PPE family protein [Mycobacterium marseillense]MDM3974629.1 PPE family protein [Mycobacterium marseillense]